MSGLWLSRAFHAHLHGNLRYAARLMRSQGAGGGIRGSERQLEFRHIFSY